MFFSIKSLKTKRIKYFKACCQFSFCYAWLASPNISLSRSLALSFSLSLSLGPNIAQLDRLFVQASHMNDVLVLGSTGYNFLLRRTCVLLCSARIQCQTVYFPVNLLQDKWNYFHFCQGYPLYIFVWYHSGCKLHYNNGLTGSHLFQWIVVRCSHLVGHLGTNSQHLNPGQKHGYN